MAVWTHGPRRQRTCEEMLLIEASAFAISTRVMVITCSSVGDIIAIAQVILSSIAKGLKESTGGAQECRDFVDELEALASVMDDVGRRAHNSSDKLQGALLDDIRRCYSDVERARKLLSSFEILHPDHASDVPSGSKLGSRLTQRPLKKLQWHLMMKPEAAEFTKRFQSWRSLIHLRIALLNDENAQLRVQEQRDLVSLVRDDIAKLSDSSSAHQRALERLLDEDGAQFPAEEQRELVRLIRDDIEKLSASSSAHQHDFERNFGSDMQALSQEQRELVSLLRDDIAKLSTSSRAHQRALECLLNNDTAQVCAQEQRDLVMTIRDDIAKLSATSMAHQHECERVLGSSGVQVPVQQEQRELELGVVRSDIAELAETLNALRREVKHRFPTPSPVPQGIAPRLSILGGGFSSGSGSTIASGEGNAQHPINTAYDRTIFLEQACELPSINELFNLKPASLTSELGGMSAETFLSKSSTLASSVHDEMAPDIPPSSEDPAYPPSGLQAPIPNEFLVMGYIAMSFGPENASKLFNKFVGSRDFRSAPVGITRYQDGSYRTTSHPGIVLDYYADQKGTVVQQKMWQPSQIGDLQRHFRDATIRNPIFFIRTDYIIGVDMSHVRCGGALSIFHPNVIAPSGGLTTTNFCIKWPGYAEEFKKQVELRGAKQCQMPITLSKLVERIAKFVELFVDV
ncbi:hypothetical protein PENSPDRAFT_666072 [Peniophora sp. CONT]|nr:hypothetical protein PENSPDRAFT_666072 [Peniophora sp. CONT]